MVNWLNNLISYQFPPIFVQVLALCVHGIWWYVVTARFLIPLNSTDLPPLLTVGPLSCSQTLLSSLS